MPHVIARAVRRAVGVPKVTIRLWTIAMRFYSFSPNLGKLSVGFDIFQRNSRPARKQVVIQIVSCWRLTYRTSRVLLNDPVFYL